MNIIGIFDGAHDSGAALVKNDRLVSVINEERLTGVKLQGGFPTKAIKEILKITKTPPKSIDLIVFGSILTPQIYLRLFRSMQKNIRLDEDYFYTSRFSIKNKIADFIQFRSGITDITYDSFLGKIEKKILRKILHKDLPPSLKEKPITFIDHHTAHIYPAYYFSGKKEVLGITSDGVGDGYSFTINHCKDGKIKRLYKSKISSSLGIFYALVTAHLGYKPFRHEGKILGLAAHGNPAKVKIKFPFWIKNNNLQYTKTFGLKSRTFLKKLERYNKKDVAAWLQDNTEEYLLRIITPWLKKTKIRDVVLSGGIFTNVKINQRIHDLSEVDSVFVFPHMGDGGLGIGAALYHAKFKPTILDNVFLGPGYTNKEIKKLLQKKKLNYRLYKNIEKETAKKLSKGKVIARFTGRMEFGPRALGNRSILYQTTDKTVNDWLNKQLHRSEIMPFAPATLKEYAEKYYKGVKGAEYTAEFMTITFNCRNIMKKKCPGVVHVDGTARPQLVTKKSNPSFYKVIDEYRKLTGIPSVINTSMNVHEYPIVCTPRDAVKCFKESKLDYLAIGDYLVSRQTSP